MANAIRKSAAIALAAGLTFAGIGGVALETTVAQAQQAVSSIDETATRSLTIHKRLAPQSGNAATGEQNAASATGRPGANIGYEIKLVQELNTPADWQAAATLTPQTAASNNPVQTGTTNAQGELTFNNLAKGVYLVTETDAPDGVTKAEPFLAYVPMANPAGNGWIYNVHVYPKNTQTTVTKAVKDAGVHNGGNVEYTITTSSDSAKDSGAGTGFTIEDTLPAGVVPSAQNVVVKHEDGTAIAAGDYTLTVNGQNVKVEFNQTGRNNLSTNNTPVQVVITAAYNGTVNEATNSATVTIGTTQYTSNAVVSHWGNLTINKTGLNSAKLTGAEFQIVQCQAGGNNTWTQVANTGAQTIGGNDTFTTDADGSVTVNGIHVSDFADNVAGEGAKYCVQETKAPGGYVGSDQLYPIDLTTANKTATVDISNETSRNLLPSTGGMGIALLVLAGLGIVGVGAYSARRNAA